MADLARRNVEGNHKEAQIKVIEGDYRESSRQSIPKNSLWYWLIRLIGKWGLEE